MSRTIVAVSFVFLLVLSSATWLSCGSSKPVPAMTVYYQVGQRAETSQLLLTVVSAEREEYYFRSSPMLIFAEEHAPPGTVFISVEATAINIGTSSVGIAPGDFSIEDSRGTTYPRTDYKGLKPYPAKKLASGATAFGRILYTVPVDATGLELSCILPGTPPIMAVWVIP